MTNHTGQQFLLLIKRNPAQKYTDLLDKLCKDVQAAKDQGIATKGDLLNVKVKLNEANLALTRATDGVELSKMSLFRVCGLDLNGNFGLADEDVSPKNAKELETGYDVNQAIDNRREIRQLEELVKISKSNVNSCPQPLYAKYCSNGKLHHNKSKFIQRV